MIVVLSSHSHTQLKNKTALFISDRAERFWISGLTGDVIKVVFAEEKLWQFVYLYLGNKNRLKSYTGGGRLKWVNITKWKPRNRGQVLNRISKYNWAVSVNGKGELSPLLTSSVMWHDYKESKLPSTEILNWTELIFEFDTNIQCTLRFDSICDAME